MERKIQFKSIFCGGGGLPVLVKYQQKSRHGWSRNEVNQSSAIVVDHCIEKTLSFRVATFGFGAHSLLWSQVYDDHNDTTTITIIQQKVYFLLSLCINTQTYMHTYTRMKHMLIELFMCVCVLFFDFSAIEWKKEALNDNKTQAYLLTAFIIQKYTNVFYNLQNVKIIPIS